MTTTDYKNKIYNLIGSIYHNIDSLLTTSPRSPQWEKFSKEIIKEHPVCSACNDVSKLEVHHIRPFHLYPELELVKDNCMVFCRIHHYTIGHFSDWSAWNVKAVRDARIFKISYNKNLKLVRI